MFEASLKVFRRRCGSALEAAREKALQDPKLQELRRNAERANKEFFKGMRERMLKIDPELAEIVRKRVFERKAWKTWRDEDGGAAFGSLTVAEREQLISTMEKASKDPAVQTREGAQTRRDDIPGTQDSFPRVSKDTAECDDQNRSFCGSNL